MKPNKIVFSTWLLLVTATPSFAEIRFHGLFQDNMILQRNANTNIFGFGNDGERVEVSIAGQTHSTTVSDGKWLVSIAPVEAGGKYTLTAKASNSATLSSVSFGDVWVCSGQSNMAFSLARLEKYKGGIHKEEFDDIRDYFNDKIRVIDAGAGKTKDGPVEDICNPNPVWAPVTPELIKDFSTVAVYFGKALQESLKVPIGLIGSYNGGTKAQRWTSKPAMLQCPSGREYVRLYDSLAGTDKSTWPEGLQHYSSLYDSKIAPLTNFTIKGVIWYQGESNSGSIAQAKDYEQVLTTMIKDWRAQWGYDVPFLIVQLAPNYRFSFPFSRESQKNVADKMASAGYVNLADAGSFKNVHPPFKRTVGDRLALLARGIAYQHEVEYEYPEYEKHETSGSSVEITFKNVGEGLSTRDVILDEYSDPLKLSNETVFGFYLAGQDKVFHKAKAEITSPNTVRIHANAVSEPVAIRYGFDIYPLVNTYNSYGQPITPFRTDDWDMITNDIPESLQGNRADHSFETKHLLEGWPGIPNNDN